MSQNTCVYPQIRLDIYMFALPFSKDVDVRKRRI